MALVLNFFRPSFLLREPDDRIGNVVVHDTSLDDPNTTTQEKILVPVRDTIGESVQAFSPSEDDDALKKPENPSAPIKEKKTALYRQLSALRASFKALAAAELLGKVSLEDLQGLEHSVSILHNRIKSHIVAKSEANTTHTESLIVSSTESTRKPSTGPFCANPPGTGKNFRRRARLREKKALASAHLQNPLAAPVTVCAPNLTNFTRPKYIHGLFGPMLGLMSNNSPFEDVVFVGLDTEYNHFQDTMKCRPQAESRQPYYRIREIGFAFLDNRRVKGQENGPLIDVEQVSSKKRVKGQPHCTVAPDLDPKQLITNALRISDTKNPGMFRKVILVGQGLKSDFDVIKSDSLARGIPGGFIVTDLPNLVGVLDTNCIAQSQDWDIWSHHYRRPSNKSTLKHLMQAYELRGHGYHKACNDAAFSVRVMIMMVTETAKKRLERVGGLAEQNRSMLEFWQGVAREPASRKPKTREVITAMEEREKQETDQLVTKSEVESEGVCLIEHVEESQATISEVVEIHIKEDVPSPIIENAILESTMANRRCPTNDDDDDDLSGSHKLTDFAGSDDVAQSGEEFSSTGAQVHTLIEQIEKKKTSRFSMGLRKGLAKAFRKSHGKANVEKASKKDGTRLPGAKIWQKILRKGLKPEQLE